LSIGINIDYLKQKCADFSDTELLRFIFLENTDYVDDAILVFKQEFEKRATSINSLIEDEKIKSGLTEFVIGGIFLTSNGMFFVPNKTVEEGYFYDYPYGVATSIMGPLGIVFDEFFKSISQKEKVIKIDKNLPVSLLSRLTDSISIYSKNIKGITYTAKGKITIGLRNKMKEFTFYIDKEHLNKFLSWIDLHNLANIKKDSPREILSKWIKARINSARSHSTPLQLKLQELKKLYDEGLITQTDYDRKRQEILDRY
jgi:hypothetical protein